MTSLAWIVFSCCAVLVLDIFVNSFLFVSNKNPVMDDLKESFAIFDKNGNGRISTSELTVVMKSLGQNPTDTEILDIIKEVDADGRNNVILFQTPYSANSLSLCSRLTPIGSSYHISGGKPYGHQNPGHYKGSRR